MFLKNRDGYTIIELLVVVSIVAILSLVIIAAVRRGVDKARFAAVVSEFSQIERAFILSYYEEDRSTWWTEAELGLGNNPSLDEIIDIETGPLSSFSDYFPHSELSNALSGTLYEYDNDGDTATSCTNGQKHRGVNLLVTSVDVGFREEVDVFIDGSLTPYCGRISYDPNDTGQKPERMFYNIFDDGFDDTPIM